MRRFTNAGARRFLLLSLISATRLVAQEADPLPAKRDSSGAWPNMTAGEFTPGQGFQIFTAPRASLNISVYGLFRYITQEPPGQIFTDHLGRVRDVNPRNDINWHRTFAWLTGHFIDPKFRYNISLWSLPTTQQTLLFGNLQYRPYRWLGFGVGVAPNLTARSLTGSWPFWAGSDRLMAEEYFRGGFSSGFWITGEPIPRVLYTLSLNNNISQLGVTQANDTRNMMYSGTIRWQPTTGEFGPRNGFGDFEFHTNVATQFGASGGRSRESRYAPLGQPPNATQIKISDGLNVFELGALADGVTVITLTYNEAAIDAGVKYRGFAFQSEYYFRTLNNFLADGPLPLSSIYDHGFMAEASYMAMPKTLAVNLFGGYVFDQFRREPWELGGGLNYYPTRTRSVRLNLHLLHVDKSPASSYFGYYLAGLTGTMFSIGADILF
jgi:hypothetical protein